MRLLQSCSFVALALVLGPPAGALPPRSLPAPFTGLAPCCSDASQFHYGALPAQGDIDVTIDRRSALFEFQSGPSFFAAFRLPAVDEPYVIDVESVLSGGPDPARARVFYPLAALLNEDFLVARAAGLESLRPQTVLMERAAGPGYRLSIGVDPAQGREKYLVLFTAANLLVEHDLPAVNDPESAQRAAHEAFLGAAATGRLRVSVRRAGLTERPPATP
jgi:hypothetical protein